MAAALEQRWNPSEIATDEVATFGSAIGLSPTGALNCRTDHGSDGGRFDIFINVDHRVDENR